MRECAFSIVQLQGFLNIASALVLNCGASCRLPAQRWHVKLSSTRNLFSLR